jgi:ribosomal protein L3 glutamine methyltransferase
MFARCRRRPPKPRAPDPVELVTVLDLVRHAVTRFTAAKLVFAHGTTDPVAEAAFVVGEALHLPPDRFELFAPARVTAAERERILGLIEERIRTRKPAAYLLGRIYAAGVPFYVDERVIVPRSFLGEIIAGDAFSGGEDGLALADPDEVARVLDLRTGSGALPYSPRCGFPSPPSTLSTFRRTRSRSPARNVAEHGLDDRITLRHGDLFVPVEGERYDLIITNPPYVDEAGMAALPPECRHEPALALDGGADGIAIVERIIVEAGRHLTENAGLLCEVGRGRPVLEARYPGLGFQWLDTEESTGEVFWLTASELR